MRNEAQRNAVNPIYININLTFLQTVFIFIGSLKRTTPAFHATPPREGNLISRATARVAPTGICLVALARLDNLPVSGILIIYFFLTDYIEYLNFGIILNKEDRHYKRYYIS